MRLWLTLLAAGMFTCQASMAENYLILPFFNLSKIQNLDWIGESLAETIRESMASEGLLTLEREDRQEVFRRLSIRPYSTLTKASVIRVGESLDADLVIFGNFQLTGSEAPPSKRLGTLRIVAQILDLRKSKSGPEFTELGALEDFSRLQTHLAWQTLQFVTPKSAPSEEEFRKRQPVIRVNAIESYVRGLLATASEQKLRMFSQALQVEPQYSQANFQLGRLQLEKKQYRLAADVLIKVAPADVHYREAQFLLGLSRFRLADFDGAAQAFKTVAEAVPLNEVWNNLGAAQLRNNSPEALDSFRKALEGDATDPDYQFNVGLALYKRGDRQAAAERFRAVLERTPDDSAATLMLGRCLQTTAAKVPGSSQPPERLKETYEESAYWQLKAVLEHNK